MTCLLGLRFDLNTKFSLRADFKKRRDALRESQISDFSIEICNRCLSLDIWDHSIYHLFLSSEKNKEVDTTYLLSVIQGKDKQAVIPKVVSKETLAHFLLTDQTPLKVNRWGIPEPISGITVTPQQIEVVFVPLLALDKRGHRVGYGKGFYDRFLAQCSAQVIKVGLSFFEPISEIKDTDKFDIPLDYAVTPSAVFKFSE